MEENYIYEYRASIDLVPLKDHTWNNLKFDYFIKETDYKYY